MKEINIAKTLVVKRKEKGITQEELAKYIGVSKASISKWGTGQSYPDITFLPQPRYCFKEILKKNKMRDKKSINLIWFYYVIIM